MLFAGLKYILDQKSTGLAPIAAGKDFMLRSLNGKQTHAQKVVVR